MHQRGFDVFDVKQVLQQSYITGPIRPGERDGEWTVKLIDTLAGTTRQQVPQRELRKITQAWRERSVA
jgi:hypothetical protein